MNPQPYDTFEQSLLASAKRDAMPSERKRALAVALAGSAIIGATATTTSTAAAAGTAVAANAKSAVGLAIAKWVGAGVLGSGLVIGSVTGVVKYNEHRSAVHAADAPPVTPKQRASSRAPSSAPLQAPGNDSEALAADAAPAAAAAAVSAAEPASTVVAVPARAAVRAQARRSSSPVASTPTLAEELRLIERARTSLAADDMASADQALDAHALAFPSGVFSEEARILRIDCMARRGDRPRAQGAARAYLAAHPDSPYAPRLRALSGERKGSTPR